MKPTTEPLVILTAASARALAIDVPVDIPAEVYVVVRNDSDACVYLGRAGLLVAPEVLADALEDVTTSLLSPDELDATPEGARKTRWAPAENPRSAHLYAQALQVWEHARFADVELGNQQDFLRALREGHAPMVRASEAFFEAFHSLVAQDPLGVVTALDDVRTEVRSSWAWIGELLAEQVGRAALAEAALGACESERDAFEKQVEERDNQLAEFAPRIARVRELLAQALPAPVERTPFEEELDLALRDLEDLVEDPDQPTRQEHQRKLYAVAMKGAA